MNIDWEMIKEKYSKSYDKILSDLNLFEIYDNGTILKENICYRDLKNFFDDNGIMIEINALRQETKEQAIYKAFEILEGIK